MNESPAHEIPARQGRALKLNQGNHLKLINTHGTQVIDMWAFNSEDPHEMMSMHHTKSMLRHLLPREGEALYTYKRRPILTLVEDRSPGVHDVLLPACDKYRYQLDGVEGYHDSCGDNLMNALKAIGFPAPVATPQPLNLWMNCPVDTEGKIDYQAPLTEPGDFTTFRAEMDCVVALSACPYDLDMPINGPDCRPMEVHYQLW